MNILQQFYIKDMILFSCTIFFIFYFLIRNFNSFCSFFITVTDLRILTNMLIPGTTLIKNGSSFPPPRLFRAPRLLKIAHLSHHHAQSGQHVYSEGKSIFLYLKKVYFAQKQPPKVFYKKVIFKNFAIFTQKTSVLESFLIQLQA